MGCVCAAKGCLVAGRGFGSVVLSGRAGVWAAGRNPEAALLHQLVGHADRTQGQRDLLDDGIDKLELGSDDPADLYE